MFLNLIKKKSISILNKANEYLKTAIPQKLGRGNAL